MANLIDTIGVIAASLTTFSLLPQVFKTYKTKRTRGISFFNYAILTIGVFLWFIYGILIQNPTIAYANFITVILSSMVLFMKTKNILYKKEKP